MANRMSAAAANRLKQEEGRRAAIVLGIVAAVGCDNEKFEEQLKKLLAEFRYRPQTIKITDLLQRYDRAAHDVPKRPEGKRIAALMDAGNAARNRARDPRVLAAYAVAEIQKLRDEKNDAECAFIIRSLKHPDEVKALRRVYGHGFFLLGVYSAERQRLAFLKDKKSVAQDEALELIKRDQEEANPLGQQTRKAFALADAFVRSDGDDETLGRILDAFFGHPYRTPTKEEYGMFLAYSAALRSGDLSRQVGAVVMNALGDVVASGANDVPQFRGGLYWPDENDQRDYKRGGDSNEEMRNEAIVEVMRAIGRKGEDEALLATGREILKGTILMDITEYGRAVHAEMEALLCCARSGVSVAGGVLFTTTFPCHNCAKHIVAAGIRRVFYVEPYPKSKVRQLFEDSIAIEDADENKVEFQPFIGLGPRRFMDLYGMELGTGYPLTRKKGGKRLDWRRELAQPRVPMLPMSYLERERILIVELGQMTKNKKAKGT